MTLVAMQKNSIFLALAIPRVFSRIEPLKRTVERFKDFSIFSVDSDHNSQFAPFPKIY